MKGSTKLFRGTVRKALTCTGAALAALSIIYLSEKNSELIPEGVGHGCEVEAAVIASDDAFFDLDWDNLLIEADALSGSSVAQSVCVTRYYIIVMENAAEDPNQPDRVTAYYRLPYDENGNAVRQFSRAKSVKDTDWEHCNGMAYNPRTDKVYVSLYTSLQGGNDGDVYIMNPYTLGYEDRIHISDAYNILGIGYDSAEDRYVIQTDGKGGYALKVLDGSFRVIDDLGACDPSPGRNFNDLCVCGDYVLNYPVTAGTGIGEYLNVYSLSRRGLVGTFPEDYGITDADPNTVETESVCELGQGEFLALVNLTTNEGNRKYRLYRATVPADFSVSVLTSGEGNAGGTTGTACRGGNYDLLYEAADGYRLTGIVINGKAVNIDGQDRNSGIYKVENIQSDQTIEVRFAPAVATQTPHPTEKTLTKERVKAGRESVKNMSSTAAVSGSSSAEETAGGKQSGGTGGDNILLRKMIHSVKNMIQGDLSVSRILKLSAALLLMALLVVSAIILKVDRVRKRKHRKFEERRRVDEALLLKKREEDIKFAGRISQMSYEELKDLR
uniref:hypothetical protein n=1 Tax=Eubacterium cellulosolvens TaxID=29322 RepID=UPI000685FF34|nr:hypothetical protein [[Eubacterium] cellulosolvens]